MPRLVVFLTSFAPLSAQDGVNYFFTQLAETLQFTTFHALWPRQKKFNLGFCTRNHATKLLLNANPNCNFASNPRHITRLQDSASKRFAKRQFSVGVYIFQNQLKRKGKNEVKDCLIIFMKLQQLHGLTFVHTVLFNSESHLYLSVCSGRTQHSLSRCIQQQDRIHSLRLVCRSSNLEEISSSFKAVRRILSECFSGILHHMN